MMLLLNSSFSRYNAKFSEIICVVFVPPYRLVINIKVLYIRINIYNCVYVSRECQQDGLRIVDIETLADGYRQCAKNTTNFPVLGLIRLPSPGHTLCGICSAMRLKL